MVAAIGSQDCGSAFADVVSGPNGNGELYLRDIPFGRLNETDGQRLSTAQARAAGSALCADDSGDSYGRRTAASSHGSNADSIRRCGKAGTLRDVPTTAFRLSYQQLFASVSAPSEPSTPVLLIRSTPQLVSSAWPACGVASSAYAVAESVDAVTT